MNTRMDINGYPVEETKNGECFIWSTTQYEESNHADYSDRLWEWDSRKYNKCCFKVWGDHAQFFHNRKPEEIERFLSLYYDRKVTLTAIKQGRNAMNGYPYWIFYYKYEGE